MGNVNKCDQWEKQLLHIWCESKKISELLQSCYENKIDVELKQDTFILMSVAEEIDELFYSSKASAMVMRRGAITLHSVKGTFAKEVSKRPSYDPEPSVSEAALAC